MLSFAYDLAAGTVGTQDPGANVWASLVRVFREYGLPSAIRVDNGQPWTSPKGELGLTKLGVNIIKVGVKLERIDPGKPYQNGRHERFHLTLHQETANPPCQNMRAQQSRFDAFQRDYNEKRPHEALRQRPPASVYATSRRRFQDRVSQPEYPYWYDVVVPWTSGHIIFGTDKYFLSRALRGERIGLVEVEEGCFAVYLYDHLLGRIHTAHPDLGLIPA